MCLHESHKERHPCGDIQCIEMYCLFVGPTIEVDKDILDQTENPILTELRRQRKERGTSRQPELEDIRDKIGQAKRKLAQFKKKR